MDVALRGYIEELIERGAAPAAAGDLSAAHTIETHISLVVLCGDRAYKFKKPLDLGFLDFRALEDRRRTCADEVRLNRRLAKETYLGVATLVRRRGDQVRLLACDEAPSPDDEVLDVAVEMRRLPEEMMLECRLERGDVSRGEIAALAKQIAEFHAVCATGPSIDEHAQPAALRAQDAANLAQLGKLPPVDPVLPAGVTDLVLARMDDLLAQHRALIERRIAAGRVREGHGDLHARNICLPPGEAIIFDCVEFSLAFRCRDVAGEIAFLAMDLRHRGHPDLAEVLLRTYAESARDPGIMPLQPLHQAHYAIVRAKVEALRAAEEGDAASAEGEEAREHARQFLLRAIGLTQPPTIILMCGLPGSGKSFLATEIVRSLGFEITRSDLMRKELAGLGPTERSASAEETAQLYGDDMTRRVYARMFERTQEALAEGRTIIVDATMPARSLRAPFTEFAREHNVPLLLIEATCGERETRNRLRARTQSDTDPSDADWNIYLDAKARFEPPDELPDSQRCTIATDAGTVEDKVSVVAARLLG